MDGHRLLLQVLKVIRYSSKFILASALANSDSELAIRLKTFEGSIGTSRSVLPAFCFLRSSVTPEPPKDKQHVLLAAAP